MSEAAMVTLTENGALRAKEILERGAKQAAAVRVFVKSGGCSGYTYGMAIDDRELEGDTIVESHGVRVVVDRMSLPYLRGATVDYVETMLGGGFSVVSNPNASSSCGCGHSFRTDGTPTPEGHGEATDCH